MGFNLIHILHQMGLFARLVAGTLLVMAVASLAVFVERLWSLWRARQRSQAFSLRVGPLLERNDYHQVAQQAASCAPNPLAQLIGSGLSVYHTALQKPGAVPPIELVKRELGRRADALVVEIRRGLSVLASVGSVAPFVGLLGTVVGIIDAFEGIAKEGSGGLGAVSAGIAEALVVTAFGLVVAILAVLGFNLLSTRADAIILAVDQARGEFVDHLESAAAAVAAGARRVVPGMQPEREGAAHAA